MGSTFLTPPKDILFPVETIEGVFLIASLLGNDSGTYTDGDTFAITKGVTSGVSYGYARHNFEEGTLLRVNSRSNVGQAGITNRFDSNRTSGSRIGFARFGYNSSPIGGFHRIQAVSYNPDGYDGLVQPNEEMYACFVGRSGAVMSDRTPYTSTTIDRMVRTYGVESIVVAAGIYDIAGLYGEPRTFINITGIDISSCYVSGSKVYFKHTVQAFSSVCKFAGFGVTSKFSNYYGVQIERANSGIDSGFIPSSNITLYNSETPIFVGKGFSDGNKGAYQFGSNEDADISAVYYVAFGTSASPQRPSKLEDYKQAVVAGLFDTSGIGLSACRIDFTGTSGEVTLKDICNVASVTTSSSSAYPIIYTVNFSSPLSSTDYIVNLTIDSPTPGTTGAFYTPIVVYKSASYFNVAIVNHGGVGIVPDSSSSTSPRALGVSVIGK